MKQQSITGKFITLLIISSWLITGCQNGFFKATQTVEKQGKKIVNDWRKPPTSYSELLKRYKLVVAYRSYNPGGVSLDNRRFIFCYNSSTSYAGYVYLEVLTTHGANLALRTNIDSVKINKESASSILSEFKNTSGWNLNYNDRVKDSADNFCYYKIQKRCSILHGLLYKAEFIYNNKSAVSFLYAPERYESECCEGNVNRQKFIKIKSILDKSLGSLLLDELNE